MATPPEFTAGSVLTAAQMNAVGLWEIATTTLAAETSKQINDCFTSDFESYLIVGSITSAGSDCTLTYKLVDGTTPNASNNTNMAGYYLLVGSGTYNPNSSGGLLTYGFIGYPDATHGMSFTMNIYRPKATGYTYSIADYVGADYNGRMSNTHQTTTAYEGIQFQNNASPAITMSGTIRVYGYRN